MALFFWKQSKKDNAADVGFFFFPFPLQRKEEIFRLKTFHESLYGPAKQIHKEKVAQTKTKNPTQ